MSSKITSRVTQKQTYAYRPSLAHDVPVWGGLLCVGLIAALTITLSLEPAAKTAPQAPGPFQIAMSGPPAEIDPVGPRDDDLLTMPNLDLFPEQLDNPLGQSSNAFITLFGNGYHDGHWHYAKHKAGNHYLVDFQEDNVVGSASGASLLIRPKENMSGRNKWTAAEISSGPKYGYGRYEVVMKPSAEDGVISSFFTYTGPYFGDPHDEIDIEFVGKNTRKVEFNTFRKGKHRGHKVHELGFDAASAYHIYAFEWRQDRIRWFVDGEMVYEITGDEANLPTAPSKIYMNVWTGTPVAWHGKPTFKHSAKANYACVSYQPLYDDARDCSELYLDKILRERSRETANLVRPQLRISQ